ncbi:sodium:proton antiporter [Corallococcus sp. EGB]|uniref:cation:proton antiporter n=1 Tax=Corallococcus sp. EGB TaxID=1521117 RepID=UPI001CC0E831|nr:sodium:proton antiporter [Corallococcus sp. EGB]
MASPALANPSLTLGLSLVAGILAQLLARHLSVPGIVVLLAAGVLLGPEGLGLIQPASLGPALQTVVGFSVSVILFEGAMSLDVRKLRREARSIQRLVTLGAAVTAVGGALAARALMGWDWGVSALFGTLVMVTGPTVITPLLRRVRVSHRVATVLEAEGIFVDAVGAIIAVVALDMALHAEEGPWLLVRALGSRWGVGLAVGGVTGLLITVGLRKASWVPEDMTNVFALALVLGAFQVSNALAPESGVLAAIAAGLVVGNGRVPARREVLAFKEQLTLMLLGMLFILLAADMRLSQVTALGWRGLLTVLTLMLLVRPVAVALSTAGSGLSRNEKAFIAWLGPRGIVAAAVASLFATRLGAQGVEEGQALRALVFLVIGVTVVVQGLSGGFVAGLLGVRRVVPRGYVLLGANALARQVAHALQARDETVLLVDSSDATLTRAQQEGFRVLFGNGLEERTLLRAEPEGRQGFVGLTHNEGVNLLFAERVRALQRTARSYTALHRGHVGVSAETVRSTGGHILFGAERDLDVWVARCEQGAVSRESWHLDAPQVEAILPPATGNLEEALVPLVLERETGTVLFDESTVPMAGDRVDFLVAHGRKDEAHTWLSSHGWRPVAPDVPIPDTAPSLKGQAPSKGP